MGKDSISTSKTSVSNKKITKTFQSNNGIAREESLYKDFYEFSPLMYFTVDRSGTTVTVNPTGAEHLGYSRDELIDDTVLKVFYEEDIDKALAKVELCFDNPGEVYEWELRKKKKDGILKIAP